MGIFGQRMRIEASQLNQKKRDNKKPKAKEKNIRFHDPKSALKMISDGIKQLEEELSRQETVSEKDLKTLSQKIREQFNILFQTEVQTLRENLNNLVGSVLNDINQPELTRALLHNEAFEPADVIKVDDRVFFLSNVIQTKIGETYRNHIILYTPDKQNNIIPRLVYISKSAGGPRSTPKFIPGSGYSKGKEIDYKQETKLNPEILSAVEKIIEDTDNYQKDDDGKTLISFSEPALDKLKKRDKKKILTYDGEVKESTLSSIFKVAQLKEKNLEKMVISQNNEPNYNEENAKEEWNLFVKSLQDLKIPNADAPDFSKPSKKYTMRHFVLGECSVQVFEKNGIEWHLAYDQDGRVWIERIRDASSKVNSYGTDDKVIDGGILTMKPLEYRNQIPKYLADKEPPLDSDRLTDKEKDPQNPLSYVDISESILSKISIIADFKVKNPDYSKKFTM